MRRSTLILTLLSVSMTLGVAATMQRIKGPGKENAEPGEFPYLAKIRAKASNKLIGAGVLLRPKVVLLIGYNYMNLKPSDIKVVLGEYDRTEEGQEVDVTEIIINPELYRTNGDYGDVALLQLANYPEFGKTVRTFGVKNIVDSMDDLEILDDSSSCVVPGYGLIQWTEDKTKLPRYLKKFVPQMQKQRVCASIAGEAYPRKKLLCSVNDDLTSVCKFDDGSPLLCMKDGKMKLYGLTTGGTKYCDLGMSFFTRISTFYSWIKHTAYILQNN